jgi:uncharacterized protein
VRFTNRTGETATRFQDLEAALMKCPVCVTIDLTISDRQGIEIDHCPKCRGVWLDRGELDKLIERASGFASPVYPQRHPGNRDDDDDNYRHRRRKSFWAELFD